MASTEGFVVQKVNAPSACPECGSRVCCEQDTTTGLVALHCGSTHDDPASTCTWRRDVSDGTADEVVIVSPGPGPVQERCPVHPDQEIAWVLDNGVRACLTCQPPCANHPHRPGFWYGENIFLCRACTGVAEFTPAGSEFRGLTPTTRRRIAMLLVHALSHLWSASQEAAPDDATPEQLADHQGCCPQCCGPCGTIRELLDAGELDIWARGDWDLVHTAAWFDPDQRIVRRDWLTAAWANADDLGCHGPNAYPDRCPDTEPHGEHEWYGQPAALRRTCPGTP